VLRSLPEPHELAQVKMPARETHRLVETHWKAINEKAKELSAETDID